MHWQGRIDGQTGDHLRLHQLIKPIQASQQQGVVLLGFACDEGIRRNQGRIGAAGAPNAIRGQLANMAIHQTTPIYDAGDIICQEGALEIAQQQLSNTIMELLSQNHFPIILGGGHEMALGSFLGLFNSIQKTNPVSIGIINFDAHFDLREDKQATSGTSFLQIAQQLQLHHQPFHYLCLGVCENSNTAALFNRADELGVDYILDKHLTQFNLPDIKLKLDQFLAKVDMIYLSIDLDVFSYALAPGVSAPSVLGVELFVVEQMLQHIFLTKKVRLADVAECNPLCDVHNHTSRLAAYLTMEIIKNHLKN